MKETGAGISRSVAESLRDRGVRAFDVSGTGGTSFAAVEVLPGRQPGCRAQRAHRQDVLELGDPFPGVGGRARSARAPRDRERGIRSGLDVARAVALGATAAGTAGGVLRAASTGFEATKAELETLVHELKVAMFLTGSRTVAELRHAPYVVTGESRPWMRR